MSINEILRIKLGFLSGSVLKTLPTKHEMQIQFQEDPLEKGMATHSSIFAWRIPVDRGDWQATVQKELVRHD